MHDIVEGYTRVSEVLDYFIEPTLLDWIIRKGSNANKIKKQAMKVGTEVDEAIKMFVNSGKFGKVKSEEGKSCLEGFKKWFEDYSPKLKVGERLFNEEYKITGEPDLYWNDTVIDLKCASAIRPKYHLQTATYCFLSGRNKSAILRLHKHLGDYEYVERNEEDAIIDFQCFKNLLGSYRYFKKALMEPERESSNVSSPSNKTL